MPVFSKDSSSVAIWRSRPTSREADPVERFDDPRGSSGAGRPRSFWISALGGRSSGSRRNSLTHSASRSAGTPGAGPPGGGGPPRRFFLLISKHRAPDGSPPGHAPLSQAPTADHAPAGRSRPP